MKLRLIFKGGKGSGNFGHLGRQGKVGGSGKGSETWYVGLRDTSKPIPDLSREEGGAAGLGLYLAKSPEEASTWGRNIRKITVKGDVLRGLANDNFIKSAESVLNTDRYSKMVERDDRPPAYLIYDKFRQRFGDRQAAEYMMNFGYVGVEHASPRLGFGNMPNLVLFDKDAIE